MKYFDELTKAMKVISEYDRTLFLGQSVVWDGHALFKTLKDVPIEKKIEMPVAEEFQMGITTGLALEGFIPISIFPRWDFLIVGTSQLVNHLDKIPIVSEGEFRPKAIIRVGVGSKWPLDPGPQHCQDHTEAFEKMLETVEVIKLKEPEDIVPAYVKAVERKDGKSTLIVEYMDFYNAK